MAEIGKFSDRGKESVTSTNEKNQDILRSMQEKRLKSDNVKGRMDQEEGLSRKGEGRDNQKQQPLEDALGMIKGAAGFNLGVLKKEIQSKPMRGHGDSASYCDGGVTTMGRCPDSMDCD